MAVFVTGVLSLAARPALAALPVSPPPAVEYPVGSIYEGGINSAAFGPEGDLWFTQESGREPRGTIERIAPTGQLTGYHETSGAVPRDVILGSDGNMWLTQGSDGGAILRDTPAEELTPFSVNDPFVPGSGPLTIAAGPDGNLWFTDALENESLKAKYIGRMTAAGVFTPFRIPLLGEGGIAAESEPRGIAAGPGGLWITDDGHTAHGHGFVARVDTSGHFTEFPLPNPDAEPSAIVEGSDGNMWFTEPRPGAIARITPSGSVTEFPVPEVRASPQNLVRAPDGNLWYTVGAGPLWFAEGPQSVGWITPAGVVGQFALPSTSEGSLEFLVSGPGETMWFADNLYLRENQYVGYFHLPRLPVATSAPTISGEPVVEHTLAATAGSWANSPTATGYQWEECEADGGGCMPIPGANGPSFTPLDGQILHRLRVAASAADIVGEATQVSALTAVIPARTKPPPMRLSAVAAFATWRFARARHAVRVLQLSVRALSPGETILLTCKGAGCVNHRSLLARRGHCSASRCTRTQSSGHANQIALARLFAGMRLRTGAKLTIAVVKPGLLGRTYTFVIKPNHSAVETSSCLQPGSFTVAYEC